jgi:Tol biopolymer transport system component
LSGALAALLLLAVAALVVLMLRRTEVPVVRAAVEMEKGVEVLPFDMAFSPDGANLAFVGASSTSQELWVRPVGSSKARALAGTEDARYPFWAPDGKRIGFFSNSKLKIADLSGGLVVALADATDGRGGTWNKDDIIVYAPTLNGPLWRVAANGGAPTQLTEISVSAQETGHRWPVFLPDGRHLLIYVVGPRSSGTPSLDPADKVTGLYTLDLQTRERKFLIASDSGAAYASGHLLYFYRQSLMARPFDPSRLQLSGTPTGLAQEQVGYDTDRWSAAFAVAPNGLLAFVSGNAGAAQLEWLDRSGKLLSTIATPDLIPLYPALSPDGKRVAVTNPTGQQNDIWIVDLERGTKSRLTFDGNSSGPVWSPDGKRVAYTSQRAGTSGAFVKDANGLGVEQAVAMPGADTYTILTDWSRDGSAMIAASSGALRRNRLYVHWMAAGHKDGWLQPDGLRSIGWREATFSPDGKWLAYSANESGQWEIYVVPFPQVNGKFQISINGGMQPRWRHDGKEMFFVGIDRKMYAVSISTQPAFHSGNPTPLFTEQQPFTLPAATPQYEVAADGKRFLMTRRSAQETGANPITLVTNWTAELKK